MGDTSYSESADQADEYARAALTLMRAKGVVANPNNFAVWYCHFSGKRPELSQTLQILLDNGQNFTPERSDELFRRFFTVEEENKNLFETAGQIENEISKILTTLDLAGDGAARYGRTLSDASRSIGGAGAEDLQGMIVKVIKETRGMERLNKALENQLEKSSGEIVQLKDDLEEMRREAMTDSLTGLANRKRFDLELRRAAMTAMEDGAPLCLLMVDIDHFKRFNDTYGHQVGDQVLKLLGATLKASVRADDMAARYGGEEFAIILPQTKIDEAKKVAEEIRHKISAKNLINRQTKEDMGKITVSMGIAQFAYGESLGVLIKRADQALYMAKRTGRDRSLSERDLDDKALSFDH
ncbi:GGDEF domain-containing protein [Varunaivibrio sulfuroxidans]|uniref:diguanylate cyclase n=1 Tax=Varunaivibrio sulfuroxidans TaxID=1773489 RepID=A0A4R3JDR5_9PROT|nr:GGDEF domain-containing protein [Varunaivibrio sulfuroxidans]TCS63565.1 diguanylate cyclase [Varunaivibrio sulfuroxidans]WES30292.1 GGDEF domain-containing protein [Varunaivibrio sulfuroxidans]